MSTPGSDRISVDPPSSIVVLSVFGSHWPWIELKSDFGWTLTAVATLRGRGATVDDVQGRGDGGGDDDGQGDDAEQDPHQNRLTLRRPPQVRGLGNGSWRTPVGSASSWDY
jgi:hypothetical protein